MPWEIQDFKFIFDKEDIGLIELVNNYCLVKFNSESYTDKDKYYEKVSKGLSYLSSIKFEIDKKNPLKSYSKLCKLLDGFEF